VAGDKGRRGGVPNRGGGEPREVDRAAASAETPGPGSEDAGAAPASGVREPCAPLSPWLGVGICRTVGLPGNWPEGTGEANRAMEVARGTELACECALESGDEEMGTGNGLEERPSCGVDMVSQRGYRIVAFSLVSY
jgi:hypothetical protein